MPSDLLELVAAAQSDELLGLVRQLERARDVALLRLVAPPRRLLTPGDAALLVSLPERRLRSLARGKPWALRIGGALRIDEAGLLAWARCSQRAGNRTKHAENGRRDVQSEHESERFERRSALRPGKH